MIFMINDMDIEHEVRAINALSMEFLNMPNQCAYSDAIVRKIIEHAEKLKKLDESNKPEKDD